MFGKYLTVNGNLEYKLWAILRYSKLSKYFWILEFNQWPQILILSPNMIQQTSFIIFVLFLIFHIFFLVSWFGIFPFFKFLWVLHENEFKSWCKRVCIQHTSHFPAWMVLHIIPNQVKSQDQIYSPKLGSF